jgi:hypothetical protein
MPHNRWNSTEPNTTFRLQNPPGGEQDPIFDRIYWYGIDGNDSNLALIIFFDLFRYTLWKFKTRRNTQIKELSEIFTAMLDTIITIKTKLRALFFNNRLIANILQALG